jgi:hypothetical protein
MIQKSIINKTKTYLHKSKPGRRKYQADDDSACVSKKGERSRDSSNFDDYTSEDIYGAVNAVSKLLICVYANELTHQVHVILRYQIEKGCDCGKPQINRYFESMQPRHEKIIEYWNKVLLKSVKRALSNDTSIVF